MIMFPYIIFSHLDRKSIGCSYTFTYCFKIMPCMKKPTLTKYFFFCILSLLNNHVLYIRIISLTAWFKLSIFNITLYGKCPIYAVKWCHHIVGGHIRFQYYIHTDNALNKIYLYSFFFHFKQEKTPIFDDVPPR